jgi:MoxR-like ATPase
MMPTGTQSHAHGMSPEEAIRRVAKLRAALISEVHKIIIGQDDMIEQMLIALCARGHCLTIGVPGLAKTLTVSTLAQALHLKFSRIQFTPDLMPSDITGTEIIEDAGTTGRREFRFVRGPIFANIVLADEINRTPPKTQAALLQSMQEYQVTAGGQTLDLDLPFFVMATQNPIEQEGTYPLPEAQLDRFMLSINVGYPSRDEERQIVKATTRSGTEQVQTVLGARDILWIQQLVRQIPTSDHVVDYAVDLARATRGGEADAPKFVKDWLAWGAGPRAAQYLILGAKARALLDGRLAVHADDVRALAKPVLRHRIFTNFNADAEGVSTDQVIERLLETVPEPAYGEPMSIARATARRSRQGSQASGAGVSPRNSAAADGTSASVRAAGGPAEPKGRPGQAPLPRGDSPPPAPPGEAHHLQPPPPPNAERPGDA